MLDNVKRNCPNCGAPITTEVCPYCNIMTGLDTKYADMEYPVIECKEASIRFVNFWLPMIVAVGFGFCGFVFPFVFLKLHNFKMLPENNKKGAWSEPRTQKAQF